MEAKFVRYETLSPWLADGNGPIQFGLAVWEDDGGDLTYSVAEIRENGPRNRSVRMPQKQAFRVWLNSAADVFGCDLVSQYDEDD